MSKGNALSLSSSFDRERFLREYWQQKPVLIRDFIPGFKDIISPEEVAGLACEAEIESRLITEAGDRDWQLESGPIPEARFDALGDSHWTLLVQALDQWLPAAAELRQLFDFLPNWRIDDVMVSFAAPQGSVGPHFDQYDVFLLQGSGSRRWQIGELCDRHTPCRQVNGLQLLEQFTALETHDLKPGDVLYLPPRYSHWGSALEAGLCYSIGLRAPSLAEMLEGFSDELIDKADPGERFVDSAPQIPGHPGQILPQQLTDSYQRLQRSLDNPEAFAHWFGSAVSAPKYPEQILPPATEFNPETLEKALADKPELLRHPGSRFAFMPRADGSVWIFVDGEAWTLSSGNLEFAQELCDLSTNNIIEINQKYGDDQGRQCLLELVNRGSLVFSD